MAYLSAAEIEELLKEDEAEIVDLDTIQKKMRKEQKKANQITKVKQYELRD